MDDSPSLDAKLLAASGAGDNAPPASVSEISSRLKRVVEGEFGYVRIRGEISGYKRAASGHVYLALKDDKAVLDGVMWKGNAARLPFQPEDGVEVVVAGKLTTYAGRSKYQIVIESMELAGEGALMQLFEKLKAKLAGEGIFDSEHKRAIPFLPKTIGVVTSPTGSVIRDILHRLADRCPSHVIVWPVLVQGEGAAKQIAAAVDGFSALPEDGPVARPDLVIVARGGGSIEDLWSFNEEIVVRAVAGCSIPVISAVGHETDTTLCDFAADLRAPTPTAAAEMAVPVRAEWLASLSETRARLSRGVQRGWQTATERLEAQRRLMPALTEVLRPHQQRVDENGEHLKNGLQKAIAGAHSRFARSEGALRPVMLKQRANLAMERLERAAFKPDLLKRSLSESQKRFDGISRVFGQLSPDGPLQRGFARVSGPDGALVASVKAAHAAQAVTLHFADGQVNAAIGDGAAKPSIKTAPKLKRVKKTPDDRQQDLF